MTNFERLKRLTHSELAKELALIASWNRTEYHKACRAPGLEKLHAGLARLGI